MALVEIRAAFKCDCCGKPFSVSMEAPYVPPQSWSLFDCAVDAVRGSVGYQGPAKPTGLGGDCRVEAGEHLCGYCEQIPRKTRRKTSVLGARDTDR